MALAFAPITFALATVAAPGTSVGPSTAVPDNCHTVIVTNKSLTLFGLVGVAVPGVALVDGTNATSLLPGASITLAVQTLRHRGFLDQAAVAGSGLAFDAVGGGIVYSVVYINELGGAG